MSLIELFLLASLLYWLIYIVFWLLLDCNFALWYKDHFGVPTSKLSGQVVWITGASSGIGRALALCLARNGARLVLSARRKTLLDELRADCLAQSAGKLSEKDVLVLQMDMLDIKSHQRHFDTVIEHFGRLNILVNNAGRSQRALWEDISVEVDRQLFELDVFSVLNLSRIVVRYFQQQTNGKGHIAVTSSIAGFCVVPMSASYCAAKHALNAYMTALRFEQPSIDVTIYAPGPIATNFLEEAFTGAPDTKVGQSTKNQKRMTAERCAHLFAVSLANKMDLTWCGLFPVNFLAYTARYPTLAKLMFHIIGRATLTKIREGKI